MRKKARARYLALHDLAFIDKSVNPLFIGTPGTGKTFLARSLAFRACQANRRVVLVNAPKMLNDDTPATRLCSTTQRLAGRTPPAPRDNRVLSRWSYPAHVDLPVGAF